MGENHCFLSKKYSKPSTRINDNLNRGTCTQEYPSHQEKKNFTFSNGNKRSKTNTDRAHISFCSLLFFLFSVKYKSPLTERSFPTVNLETEFKKNYASPSRKYFTRNYGFACPQICGTLFPGLHRFVALYFLAYTGTRRPRYRSKNCKSERNQSITCTKNNRTDKAHIQARINIIETRSSIL